MKRIIILAALFSAATAQAGFFEFSAGASYTRSDYDRGSYSWNRRYGTSIGYNFNDNSQIEFSFQDSYERTHYAGFEDSFYDDQVYSVNWVQNILGKQSPIQPYVKAGIGQLNRKATVQISTGQKQVSEVDSVTGVLGVGLRIYLTKSLALRFEGTSYLVGGRLRTWNENFGLTAGASIFF